MTTTLTTPKRYTVELTEAELDIVKAALGRTPAAKPVRERRAAAAPTVRMGKPPRLTDRHRVDLAGRWEVAVQRAIDAPGSWGDYLAAGVSTTMGYHGNADAVKRAWGIPTE